MNLKNTFFSLLILLPFLGTTQSKLTLTGKIKGLDEGAPVFLTNANNIADTLAKATVSKESFVLKAELKEPMLVNLWLLNDKNIFTFLDNSKVKVSGDIGEFEKIKISGSTVNNDFLSFRKTFDPLFDRLRKLNQQRQFQMQLTQNPAAGLDEFNALADTVMNEMDVFIGKHRSSPVSALLLYATMGLKDDILATESRYNQLKPSAVNNIYGVNVRNTIDETKVTAIGSVAMDFTQADTSGHPVSLSSFRGKYVLVDFWASWCGPCRAENPNVVSTYHKFKDKNFTVLGVSLDREGQKDRWLQAIHADRLTWTHVSDLKFWENAVARQYKVQSIPQNFLIGPDGKIVAKNLRGPALEAKLCEVLGCN